MFLKQYCHVMRIIGRIFILMFFILILVIAANGTDIPFEEVSAKEILDKIKNGEPVEYDHVRIKGNLFLEKSGLPEEKIELRSVGIYPRISSLNASIINSSIAITNSYIEGLTDFKTSIFNGMVNFENTNFIGDSLFLASKFNNDTIFAGSRFSQNAQFDNCQFNAPAFFYDSIFEKDITFEGTKFNNVVSFWNSRFEGNATFLRSQFHGNYVDFGRSSFDKDVVFKESKFSGNAHFLRVKFNQSADFSSSDLSQLDPNLLHLQWSFFQGHLSYNEILYISLIRKFKDLGQFEDARNCYYDYRNEKLNLEPVGLTKVLDYLSWISCGYGVRPGYTIGMIFAFIIFFGFIYWSGERILDSLHSFWLLFSRRKSAFKREKWIRKNPSFLQSIYISLLVFFHANPPAYLFSSGRWKYLVTTEDILGWFFLALFVVVLVNVIITW